MKSQPTFRRATLASALVLALALGGCGIIGGKDKAKTTPTVGQRTPILSKIEAGTKVDDTISLTQVILPLPEVNADFAQGGGNASKSYGHVALGA
ncbi:MAG: pyrrolo-quinoline quinone, partial [Novosphingobium sp.]|nr:pyrrolo-quinoline quinone [Novosphingobium sp.]